MKLNKMEPEDWQSLLEQEICVSDRLSELPGAPNGQVSWVAERFAAIGWAGFLVTTWGLAGGNDDEARAAAK